MSIDDLPKNENLINIVSKIDVLTECNRDKSMSEKKQSRRMLVYIGRDIDGVNLCVLLPRTVFFFLLQHLFLSLRCARGRERER